MTEIVLSIIFLIIFLCFLYKSEKDGQRTDTVIKTYESTLSKVFDSVEGMNNKFLEMTANMQMEHFKQMESITAKQADVFSENVDKLLKLLEEEKEKQEMVRKNEDMIEKITRIGDEENQIEKINENETPLEDMPMLPLKPGQSFNLQIEGDETIYPITVE